MRDAIRANAQVWSVITLSEEAMRMRSISRSLVWIVQCVGAASCSPSTPKPADAAAREQSAVVPDTTSRPRTDTLRPVLSREDSTRLARARKDSLRAADSVRILRSYKGRLTEQLRDPESVRFGRTWLVRDEGDPVACGYVNARNGFGGMSGNKPFAVTKDGVFVVDDGEGPEAMIFSAFCDGGIARMAEDVWKNRQRRDSSQ
jgi:hypothetical protein